MTHDTTEFACAAAPLPVHRIYLLGGLSAIGSTGEVITQFRTRKTAFLLSYLALNRKRKHSREELIELFWADLPQDAARDNLSGCLSVLRRRFRGAGDAQPVIAASRDAVWLNLPVVTVDVMEFERLLDSVDRVSDVSERCALLKSAVALYHGPLLNGMYEEWLLSEQARLSERFTLALIALADAQHSMGDSETALSTARQAQQADPYNEASYQTRMRILASLGRLEAARTVFQEHCDYLEQHLGCRPSPAMQQHFHSLDKIPLSASQPFVEAASKIKTVPTTPATSLSQFEEADALPAPVTQTRLWGREQEMYRIVRMMTAVEGPRLVTVTGTGGIGKTRFATAAAAKITGQDTSVSGLWVSLAEVQDVSQALPTLARVLGKESGSREGDALEAVCASLALSTVNIPGRQRTLLVLDNAEHLLPRPQNTTQEKQPSLLSLLRILLHRVPHLTLLVTSRRALGLYGEQEFPLAPLSEESAIMVFAERAELVRPGFDHQAHVDTIREIVRRVDGFPLALEMVASWSRTLTPTQIARRLTTPTAGDSSSALNLLVNHSQDIPKRHRNIRETLLWSLDMLPGDVHRVFAFLSVFHGGWTAETAEAIIGIDALGALQQLAEHSLITTMISVQPSAHSNIPITDDQRLRFLEPVRELASEMLGRLEAEEQDSICLRHARYFAMILKEIAQKYKHPAEIRTKFQADESNMRNAVKFLIQRASDAETNFTAEEAAKAVIDYSNVLFSDGGEREAWEIMRYTLKTLTHIPPIWCARLRYNGIRLAYRLHIHDEIPFILNDIEYVANSAGDRTLLARTRASRANYANYLKQHEEAVAISRQALEDFPDIFANGSREYTTLLINWGSFLAAQGDLDEALAVQKRALEAGRASDDIAYIQLSLANIIQCYLDQKDFVNAKSYSQEALQASCTQGKTDNIISTLFLIAAVGVGTGDYMRAVRLHSAAATLASAEAKKRGVPLSDYHRLEFYYIHKDDWRSSLSVERVQQNEWEGSQMSYDEAIAYAYSMTTR